jgi:hypothetical protein
MFACVLGLVFANFSEPNFQILKTKPKNTADIFSYVKNLPMPFVTQEFFGSVNFDDNGVVSFYHMPKGNHKMAVMYIHPMIFKNENSHKNIKKFLNQSVRIKGEIILKNGQEFLSVTEFEMLILGDQYASPY